ncbi:MAG TPA: glycosyltransferase, partial [Nitrospirae bacterium]|nr:glycosyltransferase [Nitrospirota bacterium]
GGKQSRYMSLIKKTQIEDKFIFTGKITEGMNEVYSAGDVLVHPTYYDPFSNVCLEAMSYGLPVITTEINGFSEIMKNEIHGYTVPDPADNRKISTFMEKLSNREIRMKMSENCLSASRRFTTDSHIDSLLNIYREVYKSKKRGLDSLAVKDIL